MGRPTSEIHLREIIELFSQIDDYKGCFLNINKCDGTCGCHIGWRVITDQMEKMLDEVTIDKVLKKI
jgi:DNA-binding IscR family transcriptional regulator